MKRPRRIRTSVTKRRKALILAACLLPFVLMLLAEAALRVLGWGAPPSLFLADPAQARWVPNPVFAQGLIGFRTSARPDLAVVPFQKGPETTRVFVLGESAALGTPDPAFGFVRQLELLLAMRHPQRRFELVNTAMRGIDSFVQAAQAREIMAMAPDLLIVYAGNNEMIGLHGCDPAEGALAYDRRLLVLGEWMRRTRLAGALTRFRGRGKAPVRREDQSNEFFRSKRTAPTDWRRDRVRSNFVSNMESICRDAANARARVLLCTVAVNLDRFPPLAAWDPPGKVAAGPEWEAALAEVTRAEAGTDPGAGLRAADLALSFRPEHAVLHFRRGRFLQALGRQAEAEAAFRQARDCDALPVRTDSRMNALVRDLAASRAGQGVRLVDLERELVGGGSTNVGEAVEGLFHDHVHFNLAGDLAVAQRLCMAIEEALGIAPTGDPLFPNLAEWREMIPYTPVDDINVAEAVLAMWRRPPFLDQVGQAEHVRALEGRIQKLRSRLTPRDVEQAVASHRRAMQIREGDWRVRDSLGALLLQLDRPHEAVTEFRELCRRYPRWVPFRVSLASALRAAGDQAGARTEWTKALELDPEDPLLSLNPAVD